MLPFVGRPRRPKRARGSNARRDRRFPAVPASPRWRAAPAHIFPAGRATFTDREKEVLELLIAGRSNKEIGSPLGIGERTVKAHVAKLMRKVGVQNRIALSVHALTHSLAIAK